MTDSTASRRRKRHPPGGAGTLSCRLRGAIRDAAMREEDGVNGLAERAGVDVRVIVRFLRGQRSLALPTVDRIATALGLGLTIEETPGGAASPVSARKTTPKAHGQTAPGKTLPANLPGATNGDVREKAAATPTL